MLTEDVTRAYVEGYDTDGVPQWEIIEDPQYFTSKEGNWIIVKLKVINIE